MFMTYASRATSNNVPNSFFFDARKNLHGNDVDNLKRLMRLEFFFFVEFVVTGPNTKTQTELGI